MSLNDFSLWVIFYNSFYELFIYFTHFYITLLVLLPSQLLRVLDTLGILALYMDIYIYTCMYIYIYTASILGFPVVCCCMICQFLKVPSTPTYKIYYQELILLYLALLFYTPIFIHIISILSEHFLNYTSIHVLTFILILG